jgi:hypothetical protein
VKTWQKVLIGVTVAVVALVSIVFWATGGITKTADDFFAAARSGDLDAAYALTSQQFREGLSQEDLARFLKASKLDQVADTSWSSRSIQADTGTVEGSVTTTSGAKIPLTIKLVKEDDAWKIITIDSTLAGLGKDSVMSTDTPPPDEQQRMVLADTRQMIEAIIDDDLPHFLERWIKGAENEDFKTGFATLRPYSRAMVALAQKAPEITGVSMDKKGILSLEGTYRGNGNRAVAQFRYRKIGGEWKIVYYDYVIEPDPDARTQGDEG